MGSGNAVVFVAAPFRAAAFDYRPLPDAIELIRKPARLKPASTKAERRPGGAYITVFAMSAMTRFKLSRITL
jgi:hypothetical protein